MYEYLRSLGYRPHGWRVGRNHGLTDTLVEGVEARSVLGLGGPRSSQAEVA